MKACKVTFSLQLLLEQIGLESRADQLIPYASSVNEYNRTVTLYLTGDHPDLPEVKAGDDIPDAMIICKRIESKLEMMSHSSVHIEPAKPPSILTGGVVMLEGSAVMNKGETIVPRRREQQR